MYGKQGSGAVKEELANRSRMNQTAKILLQFSE